MRLCAPRLSLRARALQRNGFGNDEHDCQVMREVPAGIEQARAFDADFRGALFQLLEFVEGLAEDPRRCGRCRPDFASLSCRSCEPRRDFRRRCARNGASIPFRLPRFARSSRPGRGDLLGVLRGGQSRAAAEDQQIGKRISAQAVRAMQPAGRFARGEKSGDGGLRRFGFHANAAHHVMAGGANFHGAFGDVHVRQFLELVIHAGKFPLHVFGGLVRNVEKRAAVLGAAAFSALRCRSSGRRRRAWKVPCASGRISP